MVSEWVLPEFEDQKYKPGDISSEVIEFLHENFSNVVSIDSPSILTDEKWVLKNEGYAGHVTLPGGNIIVLEPKVKLDNILAMMEYAYRLGEFSEDAYEADTVQGFYDRLANILAENVIDRRKRGLYRSYVDREERSETIRGRLDFSKTIQRPFDPAAAIEYSEMTADNEENQILLYTLSRISSSADLCRKETLRKARSGIRDLRGVVSHREFRPVDCADRQYNRLNDDYARLHSLCRLLLDSTGPSYKLGDREAIPFHVDMAKLYQSFVTEWMREHLPSRFRVEGEEKLTLAEYEQSQDLNYRIDIVLKDKNSNQTLCVLDAKYKASGRPETSDISQMVGYAKALDTDETFLLYPTSLDEDLDIQLSDVRVRDLTFELNGDIESCGASFLDDLADALSIPEIAS